MGENVKVKARYTGMRKRRKGIGGAGAQSQPFARCSGRRGDKWVSFLNFAVPSHLWVAQLTHPFPSSKDLAHWLKLD